MGDAEQARRRLDEWYPSGAAAVRSRAFVFPAWWPPALFAVLPLCRLAQAGNYLFMRFVNQLRTAKQDNGKRYSSNAIKSKLMATPARRKNCTSMC